MISHMYGKIYFISKKYLILESNYTGYKINIIDNKDYEINKFYKIYIHKILKIDNKNIVSEELFGFNDYNQKKLFSDLLTIHGIGVITASNILRNDINLLMQYIAQENFNALKQLNNINEKLAILIISSISSKYKNSKYVNTDEPTNNDDLILALKQLGYEKQDINVAIQKCDINLPLDELIASSIQIIAKEHQNA